MKKTPATTTGKVTATPGDLQKILSKVVDTKNSSKKAKVVVEVSKKEKKSKETPPKEKEQPAAAADAAPEPAPIKQKRKKDANAPKQAKSSYMYFTEKERQKIVKENPGMKQPEIFKELGKHWSALSDKEKKPFDKLHDKDKARFDEEMKTYVPPAPEIQGDADGAAGGKDGKTKRQKRDPNAPKNALNPYLCFVMHARNDPNIVPKDTEPKETMKIIGAAWSKLSEDDRKLFEDRSAKDKVRYSEEMEKWNSKSN